MLTPEQLDHFAAVIACTNLGPNVERDRLTRNEACRLVVAIFGASWIPRPELLAHINDAAAHTREVLALGRSADDARHSFALALWGLCVDRSLPLPDSVLVA